MRVWLHWNCPRSCDWWQRGTNANICIGFSGCPLGKSRPQYIVVDENQNQITEYSKNLKMCSHVGDDDWKIWLDGGREKVVFT